MNVTNEILIEAKVNNAKKSTGTTWLLYIFLGGLGAHRFYLGKLGTAWAQVILFILGILTLGLMFIPLAIWLFVDLFLISGMIRDHTNLVYQNARYEVMALVD